MAHAHVRRRCGVNARRALRRFCPVALRVLLAAVAGARTIGTVRGRTRWPPRVLLRRDRSLMLRVTLLGGVALRRPLRVLVVLRRRLLRVGGPVRMVRDASAREGPSDRRRRDGWPRAACAAAREHEGLYASSNCSCACPITALVRCRRGARGEPRWTSWCERGGRCGRRAVRARADTRCTR